MTIEFDTTDYEFAHGHRPRGVGGWAFSLKRNPPMEQVVWVPPPARTYGEAKRWMRQHLVERFGRPLNGVVYVCT